MPDAVKSRGNSKRRARGGPDKRKGEVFAPQEVVDAQIARYIESLKVANEQDDKLSRALDELADEAVNSENTLPDDLDHLKKRVDVTVKLHAAAVKRVQNAETRLGIMHARVRHTEQAQKARSQASVDPIEQVKRELDALG